MKTIHQHLIRAGLVFGCLLSAHSAFAQNSAPFYLAPFGSYFHPGGNTHGFDGWGAGLGIGKVITDHINVEARGFWQNYSNDLPCCGGETNTYGATVDGQYYFTRGRFAPYLVAGLGGMMTDISTTYSKGSAHSLIVEAGAGSTFQVTDNLLIRGDVRYRLNTLPNEVSNTGVLNDLVVNLGLVVNLF